MNKDIDYAMLLFTQQIEKEYHKRCQSYYQIGVCYSLKARLEGKENYQSNLSSAFFSFFDAIFFSKEEENFKILEKSKNKIQKIYYSFDDKERERCLISLYSCLSPLINWTNL